MFALFFAFASAATAATLAMFARVLLAERQQRRAQMFRAEVFLESKARRRAINEEAERRSALAASERRG